MPYDDDLCCDDMAEVMLNVGWDIIYQSINPSISQLIDQSINNSFIQSIARPAQHTDRSIN